GGGMMPSTPVTVPLPVRSSSRPSASDAVMVKPYAEALVGVPVRVPFPDRLSPAGRRPALTRNWYGATPLPPTKFTLYGTPCVGVGTVVGATVMVWAAVAKAHSSRPAALLQVAKRRDQVF